MRIPANCVRKTKLYMQNNQLYRKRHFEKRYIIFQYYIKYLNFSEKKAVCVFTFIKFTFNYLFYYTQ